MMHETLGTRIGQVADLRDAQGLREGQHMLATRLTEVEECISVHDVREFMRRIMALSHKLVTLVATVQESLSLTILATAMGQLILPARLWLSFLDSLKFISFARSLGEHLILVGHGDSSHYLFMVRALKSAPRQSSRILLCLLNPTHWGRIPTFTMKMCSENMSTMAGARNMGSIP